MAIVGLIFRIIGWVLLALILLIIILLHFSAVVKLHIGKDGLKYKVKWLFLTLLDSDKPRKKKAEDDEAPSEDYDEIDEEVAELDLEDEDFTDDLEKELEEHAAEQGTADEGSGSESSEDDAAQPAAIEKSDVKKETSEKTVSDEPAKDVKDKTGSEKDKKEKKNSGGLRAKINDLKAKYYFIKPYIPFTWKMFKKLLKCIRISFDDVQMMIGREDAHEAVIYYGGLHNIVSHVIMILGGMFKLKIRRCDINCKFAENYFDGRGDLTVKARPSIIIWIVLLIGFNAVGIFIKQMLQKRKRSKAAESAAAQA